MYFFIKKNSCSEGNETNNISLMVRKDNLNNLTYTKAFVVKSQTPIKAPEVCCIWSMVAHLLPMRKPTWKHWQCKLELLRFIFNWKEDNYTTLSHLFDWNLNYKNLIASLICRLARYGSILFYQFTTKNYWDCWEGITVVQNLEVSDINWFD